MLRESAGCPDPLYIPAKAFLSICHGHGDVRSQLNLEGRTTVPVCVHAPEHQVLPFFGEAKETELFGAPRFEFSKPLPVARIAQIWTNQLEWVVELVDPCHLQATSCECGDCELGLEEVEYS